MPEYECVGHLLHVDSEIAAMAVLYLPRKHGEHSAEPFTSLYVPAMHAAHCIPSEPVYPLLQVQLINIELPSGERVYAGHWLHVDSSISPVSVEYLPLAHRVHGTEPFTSLYVPAIHAEHVTPSGPVYPLLQVQLVSSPLPLGE
jgi:hypothetical protein